ncbi:velvet factor-domain-containing protein [Chlamydoabsidia padenii]|nr:velvet factor-domain-containing protein [Chlamydoabsidia padenii]
MDRRPLDPPPIVQLITDKSNRTNQYPYFFLYATLVAESGDEKDLTFLESTRMTAGTTVQSLHRLRDCDNDEGTFFIFADISIRMEGFFRLRFTLFEITGLYAQSRCSILSDVFQVYSPKSFPGMSESTFLTRSFSEQGVRIRIRKETRANTSSSNKRRRSDGNQQSIEPKMTTQQRHQSLPAIKSTHSIMSMKNILISPIQESTDHQKSCLSPTNESSPWNHSNRSFIHELPLAAPTGPLPSTPLLESSRTPSPSNHLYHPHHTHHR